MMLLPVRNRVKGAVRWKSIFDAEAAASATAWVEGSSTCGGRWTRPTRYSILLDVEDRAWTQAVMASPEVAAMGVEA